MSEYIKNLLLNGTEYEIDDAEARAGLNACLIKPTATGTAISINNSAEMPLQAMSIDTAESVDVTVCGKNLIDVTKLVPAGWDYTIPNPLKKAGNYMASVQNVANAGSAIMFFNGGVRVGAAYGGYYFGKPSKACLMTIPEEQANCDTMRICATGGLPDYVTAKLQIEAGTTATAYEPYCEPQTVTVTPNGNEWQSLHTYLGISNITNNLNAEMQLTYVADTKTYIDNKFNDLQNAILSSGANV